jgi:superfamily II DNA/RNA helicase
MDLAIKVFDSPMIFRLRRDEEISDYMQQFYVTCQSYDEKFAVVMDILSKIQVGQAIVFCQVGCITINDFKFYFS